MRWYDHLYVGEKAAAHRYSTIRKIREGKKDRHIHVITPASDGNNILEIYSAAEFSHPYYQKQDKLILGIAGDYQEGLEVAGRIVNDIYRATGGFSLEEFLEQEDGERLE